MADDYFAIKTLGSTTNWLRQAHRKNKKRRKTRTTFTETAKANPGFEAGSETRRISNHAALPCRLRTSVADWFLEQMLRKAAVEGAVLGQQNVLEEVIALHELVPEKQVALRLF